MDCEGYRASGYEYLNGLLSPEEQRNTDDHLRGCRDCRSDLEATRAALSPLQTLPEFEPAPETWSKIERRLPSRRRPAAFPRVLGLVAAASVLVALASFAMLLSLSDAPPPVVAESGDIIPYDEPFTAETFTTLTLPEVGSLRVNAGTTLTFSDSRAVEIASGEVFADIRPSGKGFEIRSGETAARVHGTRFGFTAPSTVYVLEGLVEVRTPEGSLKLGADQAALAGRLLEVTPADYLRWLNEHQRPDLRVTLDPRDQTTITPGAPLTWHVTLETNAIAPLLLGDLDEVSQFLFLKVNDTQVSLDPTRARVTASRREGRVRLDSAHPVAIEIAVDPKLFRGKGPATVRAVFTSGADAPPGAWVGSVLSPPVRVEVR